ncbi:MAG: class I SAM-dependent rRNA methyltransferase [Elusimicrobia bacterium]|nr:class I SAM-dependent rRNA methyltransferase [Elusimicrobiota bacterium]
MAFRVTLKKNEETRLLIGHLWIFSNEIDHYSGDINNGDIIEVVSSQNEFLGLGLVNKNSLIAVRILTKEREEINVGFFKKRISQACHLRQELYPGERSYRLVYGESDFLPGLVIDKYENYLVVQVLSLGMEQRLEMISQALTEIFKPVGIYLRNDVEIRSLEGMDLYKKPLIGLEPPSNLVIEQNDLEYKVDIVNGQKTGFFFDQRDNREALKNYVSGKTVLDCFCYSGGFSMSAAKYECFKVIGVEASKDAVKEAQENAGLNGFNNCEFVTADVFDYLTEAVLKNTLFDVVNVDPPSFTKTKKNLPQAIKGYRKLNELAMQTVKKGGMLISSSCSHYLDEHTFINMLKDSALRSRRTLRLLEFRGQAKDHPVLLAMPETKYLKCAIMEVQ